MTNQDMWVHFCSQYNKTINGPTSVDKYFIQTTEIYMDIAESTSGRENKKLIVLQIFEYIRKSKKEIFKNPNFAFTLFRKMQEFLEDDKNDKEWTDKLRLIHNGIFQDFTSYMINILLNSDWFSVSNNKYTINGKC